MRIGFPTSVPRGFTYFLPCLINNNNINEITLYGSKCKITIDFNRLERRRVQVTTVGQLSTTFHKPWEVNKSNQAQFVNL